MSTEADCDVLICSLGPMVPAARVAARAGGGVGARGGSSGRPLQLPRAAVVDDEVLRIFQAAESTVRSSATAKCTRRSASSPRAVAPSACPTRRSLSQPSAAQLHTPALDRAHLDRRTRRPNDGAGRLGPASSASIRTRTVSRHWCASSRSRSTETVRARSADRLRQQHQSVHQLLGSTAAQPTVSAGSWSTSSSTGRWRRSPIPTSSATGGVPDRLAADVAGPPPLGVDARPREDPEPFLDPDSLAQERIDSWLEGRPARPWSAPSSIRSSPPHGPALAEGPGAAGRRRCAPDAAFRRTGIQLRRPRTPPTSPGSFERISRVRPGELARHLWSRSAGPTSRRCGGWPSRSAASSGADRRVARLRDSFLGALDVTGIASWARTGSTAARLRGRYLCRTSAPNRLQARRRCAVPAARRSSWRNEGTPRRGGRPGLVCPVADANATDALAARAYTVLLLGRELEDSGRDDR